MKQACVVFETPATGAAKQSLLIRGLVEADVPAFFVLLQDKAVFDGCPDSLLATEDSVRAAVFGPAPMTRALVAVVDGKLVGMATYYMIFSTFIMQPGLWLDDLYLDAAQRGKGTGRAMMTQLCAIANEHGCARVDWTVDSRNRDGRRFYARLGATISGQLQLCRLDAAAIDRLAIEHAASGTGAWPAAPSRPHLAGRT